MAKIAIVGTWYVGISNVIFFALHNEIPPIEDKETSEYLKPKDLNFTDALNKNEAYKDADFLIIAPQTDYDTDINYVDTSLVKIVIQDVLEIKSIIPVGYTKSINKNFNTSNKIYSCDIFNSDS